MNTVTVFLITRWLLQLMYSESDYSIYRPVLNSHNFRIHNPFIQHEKNCPMNCVVGAGFNPCVCILFIRAVNWLYIYLFVNCVKSPKIWFSYPAKFSSSRYINNKYSVSNDSGPPASIFSCNIHPAEYRRYSSCQIILTSKIANCSKCPTIIDTGALKLRDGSVRASGGERDSKERGTTTNELTELYDTHSSKAKPTNSNLKRH